MSDAGCKMEVRALKVVLSVLVGFIVSFVVTFTLETVTMKETVEFHHGDYISSCGSRGEDSLVKIGHFSRVVVHGNPLPRTEDIPIKQTTHTSWVSSRTRYDFY